MARAVSTNRGGQGVFSFATGLQKVPRPACRFWKRFPLASATPKPARLESAATISVDITQLLGYKNCMDKRLLAKVMAELGKRTSPAKAAAARKNGRKGGRPRKAKQ
jgi:hypothetical protein